MAFKLVPKKNLCSEWSDSDPDSELSNNESANDCASHTSEFQLEEEIDFSPERELSPKIDPKRKYTSDEQLKLAMISYWQKMREWEKPKHERIGSGKEMKKPTAAAIAREYNVKERTLQYHLTHPTVQTRKEQHQSMQVLTVGEEKALVERLQYLDDWNVPADKLQITILAEAILHKRNPDRNLGKDWFYAFQTRHNNELTFVYTQNIDSTRINYAKNWDLIDDYFGKVRLLT